jgi:hypothetical protein
MKIINLILPILVFISCNSTENSKNKKSGNHDFILQYIGELERQEKLSDSPLIVIDGLPLSLADYIANNRPMIKSEIKEIDYLKKESQVAIDVYGDGAKGGVILITTNGLNYRYKTTKTETKNETLILYDNRQISLEEFDKLDPDNIEKLDVIEDKNEIKKISGKGYKKIIVIVSKQ